MLKIKNFSIKKNEKTLIENFSIDIEKNSIIGIIGNSGFGKSSFLRSLCQIDKYDGIIEYESCNFKNYNRKDLAKIINLLPQDYSLFSNFSVIENCINPLLVIKKNNFSEAKKISEFWLKKFNILEIEKKNQNEISGGQKQRACLARAFSFDSEIYLLDEPTSALDEENIKNLKAIIKNFKNKIFIIVSHNINFIKAISDKILILEEKKFNFYKN